MTCWRLLVVAAVALLLEGCGHPSNRGTSKDASPALMSGRAVTDMRDLPAGARSAVLFRAISDTQASCSKVVNSAYQQTYKKMAMFVARCPETAPYAIFVSADGYAQVSPCSALGTDVPACRPALLSDKP